MIGSTLGLKSQDNKYILVELDKPNKTYIIDGDTFALILLSDIDKSMQKMIQGESDSATILELSKEIQNRDLEILQWSKIYNTQLVRDSLQTEVYKRQQEMYKSLEKDYSKMLTSTKLKFAFGGKLSIMYSNNNKNVNDIAMTIAPGLLFKRKYLLYSDIGISLGQNIHFGIGTFTIF